MNQPSQTEPPRTPDAADDAVRPAEPEAAAGGDETITLPVATYEQLKREVLEWKERCVRQQAEFENARRRLRKEADESSARATARAVRPVLAELDNLERALGAAQSTTFNQFAQGVTMISENLTSALAGMGLERIPCEGVFDPAVHEVIAEQDGTDQVRGTIVQVHRSGWKLKDQLVRAAQVVVAKPPAAPATPATPAAAAEAPQDALPGAS